MNLGREYEKGKKLDERYSQLTGEKGDKLAAIEEKPENKENIVEGNEHTSNKGKKKKGKNETRIATGELEQVAAVASQGNNLTRCGQWDSLSSKPHGDDNRELIVLPHHNLITQQRTPTYFRLPPNLLRTEKLHRRITSRRT